MAAKIGVSMLFTLSLPFKRMVEEVPMVGSKYVEVLDEGLHALNKRRVEVLRGVASSHGLVFTVHAPFAGVNIAVPHRSLLKASLKRLKESLVNSAALNCRLWVFHPGLRTGISMFYPGEDWARNLESVQFLCRFAEDHGVKVGLENIGEPFVLRSVDDFERFFGVVGEDVGFVFDTGHANLRGEDERFLKRLGDRLVHVHAHDNLGKSDEHLGVGCGSVDWDGFAVSLKETSFGGVVCVEAVEHVGESVQRLRQLLL